MFQDNFAVVEVNRTLSVVVVEEGEKKVEVTGPGA